MERLTTRVEDKVYYSKGEYPPTTLCAEMETWEVRECMKKLAEYENTGLTPEEIEDIKNILNENNDGWGNEEILGALIELGQYKKTGFAPEEIKELDRKYREEEYEFCGEYGTDDCQFQHILSGTEWRSDKCKKCRGYDDETDELYEQPTEWTPQKDVNK